MYIFQILVFIITISNVLSNAIENQSFNIEDLNQGEYISLQQGLKSYNHQYGYNLRASKQYPLHSHESQLIIKQTNEVPSSKKILIPYPSTLSYVYQRKIMPVKVIKEGPVKHIYLPEFYNEQSAQIKTSRTPKNYIGYQPGQYQQNFIKPALKYTSVDYSSDQGVHANGLYLSTNGYRIDPSNINTGYALQYYSTGSQYVPQNIVSPGYSSFAALPNQQFSQFINNGYLKRIPNQYSLPQEFVPTTGNQQLDNIGRQAKVSNLDPELSDIVNNVLNKGQGYSTHDGFTMIKSKTDNAIYLIGKPGMSLNTIPNFSAYNYASFQKAEEPNSSKNELKEKTSQ